MKTQHIKKHDEFHTTYFENDIEYTKAEYYFDTYKNNNGYIYVVSMFYDEDLSILFESIDKSTTQNYWDDLKSKKATE